LRGDNVNCLPATPLGLPGRQLEEATPIEYVSAAFPPTIFLHGTGDTLVPHAGSVKMFEALLGAGAPFGRTAADRPNGCRNAGGRAGQSRDVLGSPALSRSLVASSPIRSAVRL